VPDGGLPPSRRAPGGGLREPTRSGTLLQGAPRRAGRALPPRAHMAITPPGFSSLRAIGRGAGRRGRARVARRLAAAPLPQPPLPPRLRVCSKSQEPRSPYLHSRTASAAALPEDRPPPGDRTAPESARKRNREATRAASPVRFPQHRARRRLRQLVRHEAHRHEVVRGGRQARRLGARVDERQRLGGARRGLFWGRQAGRGSGVEGCDGGAARVDAGRAPRPPRSAARGGARPRAALPARPLQRGAPCPAAAALPLSHSRPLSLSLSLPCLVLAPSGAQRQNERTSRLRCS
jgi:hypothetical protein